MIIHLVRSLEVDKALFTKVVDLLQSIPGPIRVECEENALINFERDEFEKEIIADEEDLFKKKKVSYRLFLGGNMDAEESPAMHIFPIERDSVSWDSLFNIAEKYRKKNLIPRYQFVFLITNVPNNANWFAARDLNHNPYNGFIHSADWEFILNCSASFPIAYEVIALFLQKHINEEGEGLVPTLHKTSIGCVSDLCMNKREIILKLRTADICPFCINKLKEQLPLNVIHHARLIMESLRVKMLFSQNFKQDMPLSRLMINPHKKIFLADFDNLEVKLRPLEKALYFLFLGEPEGIYLSNLCDHRNRLNEIYAGLSTRGELREMQIRIDNLTNVLTNSASEKISRIRQVFEELIGKDLAEHYIIRGEVGDVKKITIQRKLVVFD
jgi:hypothetical protein